MRRVIFILLFIFTTSTSVVGQKLIFWEDLSHVRFIKKYNKHIGFNYQYPEFDNSVLSLEGEEVIITGYFLNLDPKTKKYLLSKNPMASCFFCGNGGPESVIEIFFSSPQVFEIDDLVTVTGKLRFNKDDPEHCNYIIEDADGLVLD